MQQYYAVQKGKHPGIYRSWEECRREVTGVGGAVYKKFRTLREAEAFLKADGYTPGKEEKEHAAEDADLELASLLASAGTDCIAFVDGSYHAARGIYGYGGILIQPDGSYESFQGAGEDPDLAKMRNVAGEIAGAMRAVEEALRRGYASITICYDYMGIECWARGTWKCNREGTAAYHAFMAEKMREIRIRFQKVRAHSGIRFNELADRLAKDAAGIQ